MNWYSGNIAEAVTLSKQNKSIFVVYVEGPDDLSKKLTGIINDERIRNHLESQNFVAIKIDSGTEAYMQFAQIYQLVPLPSMFFIGKDGTPISVVTGVTNTVDELEQKILQVLESTGVQTSSGGSSSAAAAAASSNFIANESQSSPQNRETEPIEKPNELSPGGAAAAARLENAQEDAESQKEIEEKMRKAKELIEKKRKEKEEEEKEAERERELRRRKEGQSVQNLKKWQEEQEMKQLKEDRKREKQLELEARRRVLDQIEQDRKERANQFEKIVSPSTSANNETGTASSSTIPKTKPMVPRAEPGEFARIQFKKPIGDSEMHMFSSNDKFSVLRSYVEENVIPGIGIRDYALATTFPRKEFTAADDNQTLVDLGLAPTAVLLILPVSRNFGGSSGVVAASASSSGGSFNFIYSIILSLLSPVMAVFGYLRNWWATRNNSETGAQKRASEEQVSDHDAAKRRNYAAFDKPKTNRIGGGSSNVHRLHENKDSDDENNTWNGNSTQQQ